MAAPESTLATAVVTGTTRQLTIPPCSLTATDLQKLYDVLDKKAREAADSQVNALQQLPGQTAEQFEEVKRNIRSSLALVVQVQGTGGEWSGAPTREPLLDNSLPDTVASVQYDSAFLFRTQFNLQPQNSFVLHLDFARTSILDTSPQPVANKSTAAISGANGTWVNGTYDELRRFFDQRSTGRGWLHSSHSYDIGLLIVGFPASFAVIYRVDHWLRPVLRVPDALFVALYVYLVLVALFGFRVLFNYAKWVFPKCEGPTRREAGPNFHKAVLVAMGVSLISVVTETLLRMMGIPLP